ncbi:acyl-homoserine-lactone synthase [Burkholderia sp. MSMB1459WGS]|uniref:acyl-homoserine-lactone synthase n=1 Tax=Burkholderia sp. MSMB1459WGS TaxID=1637970 RepID=UPI0009E8FCBB|nr:acyl-homoserine-lactone synthase [Burkholderia sp. MSMB1459WGS]
MQSIFAGRLVDIPATLRHGLGEFRYKVFVKRLGWQLPNADAVKTTEWDHFDQGDTIHVVLLDSMEQVCGCARLMQTTRPYLLQTLHAPSPNCVLPVSPTVWELSRFAASTRHVRSMGRSNGMQFFPPVLAIAASLGATRIIGALSHAIARLYRRAGLELETLPIAERANAANYLVCAINLSASTFERFGCDTSALLRNVTWLSPGSVALFASSAGHTPSHDH